LGPFRLSARLAETPAGIVFLGEDDQGRQVTVAVLRRGAAGDPAARDRFRAAILEAVPAVGRAAPDAAPVVAAQPEGPEPWVAVLYEPGGAGGVRCAGAERFLEPVALSGGGWWPRRRRGPGFAPYWAGGGGPAVPVAAAVGAPVAARGPERRLASAVLALAVMLGVLALLMLVLFACQPQVGMPPPDPPSDTPSSPSRPASPSPSPSTGSVSPSPSPTSGSPSPGRPGEPGDDEGDL
jgi:hypothetical protein